MKTKLTPVELKSLSVLLKQEERILRELNKYAILNPIKSRAYLIESEYRQLSGQTKQRKADIVLQLACKYNISVSSIELVIYSKTVNKKRTCRSCRKLITKYKYNKNKGVCDSCKPI